MSTPSSSPPVIEAYGLTKRFDSFVALDDVDLSIGRGRIVGYLGPNGAGKTTTMRLLMGLLRPTAGTATILGTDVWGGRDEVHRQVGYLPGDFTAFADLTAGQYLRHLAHLRGDVDWADAVALVERFELALDRRIGTLSNGNRRKVGIVQAFMHRPPVLLLDEPTSGLDPLMQREFASLLADVRSSGGTVLLSSHVLDEVEAVADDIMMIRKGRVVVNDTVAALKARASRSLVLRFTSTPPTDALRQVPGVARVEVDGQTARVGMTGGLAALFRTAAPHGIESISVHEPDLEDVFLTHFEEHGC